MDVRARELPGTYRRPLERMDREYWGTQPGETGRLVRMLQSYGQLQCYVAGHWGEGSRDLHHYVQCCAEARVAYIARSTGRQESERLLGSIVGQYRRLVSTTAVRAQAMCLLARVSRGAPPGGDEAGGAATEGEEGTVDGVPVWARLGQERELPHPGMSHHGKKLYSNVIDLYNVLNV